MKFEGLIGNAKVKGYLKQMVAKESIGHSLLFAGPDGVGKGQFARLLAGEILQCTHDHHPDLHIYRPEGKIGMHPIASMRKFSEEVYFAPYQSKHKIFIIEEAHRMLSYSANALLKTFEEPSIDTIIILVSSFPQMLLPTVLSRCRIVRFQAVEETEIADFLVTRGTAADLAKHLARRARGSVAKALQLAEEGACPMEETLITLLASGRYAAYGELLKAIKTVTTHIETKQKGLDEEMRQELSAGFEEMNAAQKESLQKEVDGAVSLTLADEAGHLFDTILFWFRDLHLLKTGGDPINLYHRDHAETLTQILQRGNLPSLAHIESLISGAKLSLSRSTTLAFCLEHLFLSLQQS